MRIQNTTTPTFQARVDKGLIRFYETNKTRMPKTVKAYIENTPNKDLTPIQVQKAAFAALAGITTVAGIQANFSEDKELFEDLINPEQTKATRGLLGVYRENKELLELCEQDILESKENFTVWLVKKIFLEGKTIEEINQDFDREMNQELKSIYRTKETNPVIIKPSLIKSLGIKMPESEYAQSLRYTRDGYSDIVGEKISQAQKDFWATMPIEERTARARKSVEKFEKWWNSFSRDQQLEMIALQIDEIEMLKEFNSSDIGKIKTPKKPTEIKLDKEKIEKSKVKISSQLSRDDLFKVWASNNLKLFEASLTDFDKRKIDIKREQHHAKWWNSMSPEERTEYINRLKSGAEPLKFAMIDAWNKNPDILTALSIHLKKFHITRPIDTIYGTEQFNESLKSAMIEFWETNPEYAEKLGQSITDAHNKIKDSIETGKFELLKSNILKERSTREKETLAEIKTYQYVLDNNYPEYMKDFISIYGNKASYITKNMPEEYLKDFYDSVATEISEAQVQSWIKSLLDKNLTLEDYKNLSKIRNTETPKAAIMNRALEAALAEVLYNCTRNPEVYLLSQSDCKLALAQMLEGKDEIQLHSLKLERDFSTKVLNKDFNPKLLSTLYNAYKQPIERFELDNIIEQFIRIKADSDTTQEEFDKIYNFMTFYLDLYKNSIKILFGNNSKFTPQIKAVFAKKFINNLPEEIKNIVKLTVSTEQDFLNEQHLIRINNLLRKKYNFLPREAFDLYTYELNKILRKTNGLDYYETKCCKRKISPDEESHIIALNRTEFNDYNAVYSLCIEQALADSLYEATGEDKVYQLSMEELMDIIESALMIKKLPAEQKLLPRATREEFVLKFNKKINPYRIEKLYKQYKNELLNYQQECIDENKEFEINEVLYILNPDESKTKVDEYTLERIKKIGR